MKIEYLIGQKIFSYICHLFTFRMIVLLGNSRFKAIVKYIYYYDREIYYRICFKRDYDKIFLKYFNSKIFFIYS